MIKDIDNKEIQDIFKKAKELFENIHEKSRKFWLVKEPNQLKPRKGSRPLVSSPCLIEAVRLCADSSKEVLGYFGTESLRIEIENADEMLKLLETTLTKLGITYDREQLRKHARKWFDDVPDIAASLLTMPALLILQWCLINYYNKSRYPKPGEQIPQSEYYAVPDAINVLEDALKAAKKYICFANEFFKTISCGTTLNVK